jgi:two-component system cell cycle response regulator DivK
VSVILIVEDNENNMMLVRDVLKFKGYEILEATTGAEGVRLAIECKPDLVLMDIQLPDIDGLTALAQIRADAALSRVPVLAVSASVMPDDQQRIAASGFNAFIRKPINVRNFIATVETFLSAGED